MNDYSELKIRIDGHVAVFTMYRPPPWNWRGLGADLL